MADIKGPQRSGLYAEIDRLRARAVAAEAERDDYRERWVAGCELVSAYENRLAEVDAKPSPKKRAVALVAALDADELTIRLLEIGCQMKRPAGRSAAELMADQWRTAARNPTAGHVIRTHRDMAVAAIEFMSRASTPARGHPDALRALDPALHPVSTCGGVSMLLSAQGAACFFCGKDR